MNYFATAVVLLMLMPCSAFSQSVFDFKGDAANPILQKLGVGAEKPMRMGWLIEMDKLITDLNVPTVSVYSSSQMVLTAKLMGPLSAEDLAAVRKRSCAACDPSAQYYRYQVDGTVRLDGERVLVTSALPDARLGFEKARRTSFLIKKDASLLGAGKELLHKYLYLRTSDGKFQYSFHAFYDPKSKALKGYGILLHKRGVLLARDYHLFDPAAHCRGCLLPTFKDPLEEVYAPVNFIDTTAFPCPLVLAGTLSADGKGLSILTFDMDGVKSEVRAGDPTPDCCK